jgi:hypothetical protein
MTEAGSLTITTRDIPDIDEICVRFTATNRVGTSWSTPLCFPHDLPTIPPATAPSVQIDPSYTVADGKWTFSATVNPGHLPTDVVLETGVGPASAPKFSGTVSVAKGLGDAGTLFITTSDVPDSPEICVRFTATNTVGTASSTPLCFTR